MDAQVYGNTGAKAAIEMALYDLLGRAADRPLHALLGEKKRSRMPILAVIGTGKGAAADIQEADEKRAAGYRRLQDQSRRDDADADADRTRRICAALGRGFLLSADANQGFSVDEAVRYVRAVADAGLDFFEQPVGAHDLKGMAQVAAASRVLIGADEGIHSLDDIERHHERKAVRGVSLKAIKLGGLAAVRDACVLCDRIGLNVNIVQDRRIEHCVGSGRASRRRRADDRLGRDHDQFRACRRRHQQSAEDRERPRRGTGTAWHRHRGR